MAQSRAMCAFCTFRVEFLHQRHSFQRSAERQGHLNTHVIAFRAQQRTVTSVSERRTPAERQPNHIGDFRRQKDVQNAKQSRHLQRQQSFPKKSLASNADLGNLLDDLAPKSPLSSGSRHDRKDQSQDRDFGRRWQESRPRRQSTPRGGFQSFKSKPEQPTPNASPIEENPLDLSNHDDVPQKRRKPVLKNAEDDNQYPSRRPVRRSGFVPKLRVSDEEAALKKTEHEERRKRKRQKEQMKAARKPTPIRLPEFVSVTNLAGLLKVRTETFLQKMTTLGFDDLKHDHILDAETAGLIAVEFNFEPISTKSDSIDLIAQTLPDKESLPARPPVVTIMGHVDHGKTTLLDYWRKSAVAAGEHGGITQHIGAFSVPMSAGRTVTFLDTPGHAAFLAMRQRGATVTDVVILVVAADDSVMPQTVEAIKHAQAAGVPMIVAVNKVDKEEQNVQRVKGDLARYGVEIEDYGGDTQVVCVSAKTGQGMDKLEEATVALADILDMRAPAEGMVEGWVLEATKKRTGTAATVLVRRGTLHPGNILVAGRAWARVRCMTDALGSKVLQAGPGTPVEIDGWREQPQAGDEILQTTDEQRARVVVDYRVEQMERSKLAADVSDINAVRKERDVAKNKPSEQPEAPQEASTARKVSLILKADVSGSLEAMTNSIASIGNTMIFPYILRSGVGNITEFDVEHAAVATAHIVAFNTVVDGALRRTAAAKGVKIIDESIIYRLVDETKAMLEAMLPPKVTKRVLGEAEIGQVFDINVKGRTYVPVAGCRVRNGVISRSAKVKVLRGSECIYEGTLSSLKHIKRDVSEMRRGAECGIGFSDWSAFAVGDLVQTYEELIEKSTL